MTLQTRIKNLLFPMSGGHVSELLRATFFYCPVVGPGLLILFTGFDHAWEKWSSGTVIALCCAYTCILASAIVRGGETLINRILKRKTVERPRTFGLLIAIGAMPWGMYLGFHVNGWIQHKPPEIDFDDYRV